MSIWAICEKTKHNETSPRHRTETDHMLHITDHIPHITPHRTHSPKLASIAFYIVHDDGCPTWHHDRSLHPSHFVFVENLSGVPPEIVIAKRHRYGSSCDVVTDFITTVADCYLAMWTKGVCSMLASRSRTYIFRTTQNLANLTICHVPSSGKSTFPLVATLRKLLSIGERIPFRVSITGKPLQETS